MINRPLILSSITVYFVNPTNLTCNHHVSIPHDHTVWQLFTKWQHKNGHLSLCHSKTYVNLSTCDENLCRSNIMSKNIFVWGTIAEKWQLKKTKYLDWKLKKLNLIKSPVMRSHALSHLSLDSTPPVDMISSHWQYHWTKRTGISVKLLKTWSCH